MSECITTFDPLTVMKPSLYKIFPTVCIQIALNCYVLLKGNAKKSLRCIYIVCLCTYKYKYTNKI